MYSDYGIMKWHYKPRLQKETGYEDIIDCLNIIEPSEFKKLDQTSQREYARMVLSTIRLIDVYPIYYFNDNGVHDEILKCLYTDVKPFTDELIEGSNAGNLLLDFLFPNLHLVEAGTSISNSMYSRFYDDDKLLRCLVQHMKSYRFTNMRTPFFMYGRLYWNTATNFSPMRAKAIYETFCKSGDTVYDFSCGFGGRMLGALSSRLNLTYLGCEPNTNTYHNLHTLGQHIEDVTQRRKSYQLYRSCSEDLVLPDNSVDFAFSCPPYYKLERYCDEPTQSIIRHSSYSEWLMDYVRVTLENIYSALKPGCRLGYVIAPNIYLAGVKFPLGDDWFTIAQHVGFTYERSYAIKTRSRKRDEDAETLYVFKKG